jgi:diguanylate cyclase (GGDEF)-like protein/PAS domain S-box-containing protein
VVHVVNVTPAAASATHAATYEVLLDLVDSLDAMVAYWGRDRRCVFANEAYRSWFGISGRDLVGRTMEQLLGPLYPLNRPYIDAAYAGAVQVFERAIPVPGGGVRHSLATYKPHIVAGEVQGIFVHVADVSPLKHLELELRDAIAEAERLATHDFLTGLPNRVRLSERIEDAWARSRAANAFLAVLMIDLDEFKTINDTHGHATGDRVLVEAADRLTSLLREGDSATRMGGDEFLLLRPGIATVGDAEALARRLVEVLDAPLELDAERVSVGCSVGIAMAGPGAIAPDALLAVADRALYEAKKHAVTRWCVLAG